MASEEAQLASAIDASEAEACGDYSVPKASQESPSSEYSWWDVLLGKHDQEIFERAAGLGAPGQKAQEEIKAKMTATAVSYLDFLLRNIVENLFWAGHRN